MKLSVSHAYIGSSVKTDIEMTKLKGPSSAFMKLFVSHPYMGSSATVDIEITKLKSPSSVFMKVSVHIGDITVSAQG